MVYEDVVKIYGPYTRKDNRQHIICMMKDGSRKTISYPKYLMEKRIGRYLTEEETVDHIDGDFLNNNPGNLQILGRSKHASLDVLRLKAKAFKCPLCGEGFKKEGQELQSQLTLQ